MKRTRLKYYLRALGIGIIVSTLLMGYSKRDGERMTDEEIRMEARRLGMVEQQGVLSELNAVTAAPEATKAPQQTAAPEETKAPQQSAAPEETKAPQQTATSEETKAPQQSAAPEETKAPQQTATPEETKAPQQTAAPEETEEPEALQSSGEDTVTLVIPRGETSVSVSKALAEAGLVEDYQTYDRFLCSGGYDKSINAGTYEIPVDATNEEIARIITKKR